MNRSFHYLNIIIFCLSGISFAQSPPLSVPTPDINDLKRPLPVIEKELRKMANQILNHDSTQYKMELNKQFIDRMITILGRDDSYNYKFDSIKTISRIAPKDEAFRIFTWHIVDKTTDVFRYYGLVQKKMPLDKKTKKSPILVKLLDDKIDNALGVEQTILNPQQWFGALYYKPRYSDYGVLTYKGKYEMIDGFGGKVRKKSVNYYVLLGWNGFTLGSNYKVIDVITFDPIDPSKINFGAPIFHFGQVPKSRVIFKYSDNAPFNLNLAKVIEKKWFFKRKKMMIVFDHLAPPNKVNEHEFFEYGPDGTLDAFNFYDKRFWNHRKGFFELKRNITVYNPALEKYNPKKPKEVYEYEKMRIKQYNLEQYNKNKKKQVPKLKNK